MTLANSFHVVSSNVVACACGCHDIVTGCTGRRTCTILPGCRFSMPSLGKLLQLLGILDLVM